MRLENVPFRISRPTVMLALILVSLLMPKTGLAVSRVWFNQILASQETADYVPPTSEQVQQVAEDLVRQVDHAINGSGPKRPVRRLAVNGRKHIYAVLLSVGLEKHSTMSHLGFGNTLEQAGLEAYLDWFKWAGKLKPTKGKEIAWTDIRVDAVGYVRPLGRLVNGKLVAIEPGVHAVALDASQQLVFTPNEIWAWDVFNKGTYSPLNLSKAAQIKKTIQSGSSKVAARRGVSVSQAYALDLISFGVTTGLTPKVKGHSNSVDLRKQDLQLRSYFRMHPMIDNQALEATDLIWSARKVAAYIARSVLTDYRPVGFYVPGTNHYLPEDDPATQAMTVYALYKLLEKHPNEAVKGRADLVMKRLLGKLQPASVVRGVPNADYVYLENTIGGSGGKASPISSRYQSASIYVDTISNLLLAWSEKANYEGMRRITDARYLQLGQWLQAMQRDDGQFDVMWQLPQMRMPLGEIDLAKRISRRYQNLTLNEDYSTGGINARATLALKTLNRLTGGRRYQVAADKSERSQISLFKKWVAETAGQENKAGQMLVQASHLHGADLSRPKSLLESQAWQVNLVDVQTSDQLIELMLNKTRSNYSDLNQLDWAGGINAKRDNSGQLSGLPGAQGSYGTQGQGKQIGQADLSASELPPKTYDTAAHLLSLARYLSINRDQLNETQCKKVQTAIRQSAAFLIQCQLGGERLMHIRRSHGGNGPFINHLKSRYIDLRTNLICLLAMIEGAEAIRE